MPVQVKICGINSAAAADAVLRAGADFGGLVFFAKSPRNLSLEQGAMLAERMRGRLRLAALVVARTASSWKDCQKEASVARLAAVVACRQRTDRVPVVLETSAVVVLGQVVAASDLAAGRGPAVRPKVDRQATALHHIGS